MIFLILPVVIIVFMLIYKLGKWADFAFVGGGTWYFLSSHLNWHNAYAIALTVVALIIWFALVYNFKVVMVLSTLFSASFSALVVVAVIRSEGVDVEWQIVGGIFAFIIFLVARVLSIKEVIGD